MNDATNKLFAWARSDSEIDDVNVDYNKIVEDLVKNGADIHAVDEKGLDLMQIAMGVESPKMPIDSYIEDNQGMSYHTKKGNALLKNGYDIFDGDAILLLQDFCKYLDGGSIGKDDADFICSLIRRTRNEHICFNGTRSLLRAIISVEFDEHEFYDGMEAYLSRKSLFDAYVQSGGDLYWKDADGKYAWDESYTKGLCLGSMILLLQHGINLPNEKIRCVLDVALLNFPTFPGIEIDWLRPVGFEDGKKILRELIVLSKQYPCIRELLSDALLCEIQGMDKNGIFYEDCREFACRYLEICVQFFGSARPALTACYHRKHKNCCFGLKEFKKIFPEYTQFL